MFITHDFLATMLGTDRQSVSSAASALQRNKNIKYTRGVMKILNRKLLENSACECYRVIRRFNTQIGYAWTLEFSFESTFQKVQSPR